MNKKPQVKDKTFQMRTTQEFLDKLGVYADAWGASGKAEVIERAIDMIEYLAKELSSKE